MQRQIGFGWLAAGAILFAAGERAGADGDPLVARDDRRQQRRHRQARQRLQRSQKDYKVIPTYKGGYADTMNAGIAAFRAGNAPHIMQVFEVGTATMMSATGAVKPVHVLMKEAGEAFDPEDLPVRPSPATTRPPRARCCRCPSTRRAR